MNGIYTVCIYVACALNSLFFLRENNNEIYVNKEEIAYQSQTSENTDINTDDVDYDTAVEDILNNLDVKSVDDKLRENGYGDDISFTDIISDIKDGQVKNIINRIGSLAINGIFSDLSNNKSLMIQLISIALLGSIFINISGSFGNGFVAENGFYVTYLIMTSIMLASFSVAMDMVCSSLERILVLIRIVVPVYALAMNYIGHTVTSAGMYEVILVGVWLVQAVILKFVIPLIKFYVIVSLVNNLNKEDSFSKLCLLIKNLVSWLLKTIVVFIAGLNIIKSLIEPQIDAIGRTTVNRVISAIPGGSIMSVLAGTFLGAGLVIKNCIGVAGILLIVVLVMIPVVKMFLIMFMVRITGVVIQPIGEKRYVEGIEALSGGMSLLLQTIGSSVVLFMLTIAIMAYASNGGG